MKHLKKAFITLVAALTACSSMLSLAACGGDKVDYGAEVPVVAYDGSEVTITFQHTMGQGLREVFAQSLKSFNAVYPNIKVEATCPTNDYDELRTLISTGLTAKNSPHVAFCYPDHVALYNTMNATIPLDGYINSTLTVADSTEIMGLTQAQKDDFVEAFYKEGSNFADGKTYTLPFNKSTEVLYYNKTYFQAHAADGLQEPNENWSWNDLWAACEKIKEIENGNKKIVPLGYDSEANWFITMTEQMGTPYTSATGEKYIFNTEENRAFVTDLREKYQQGLFTTKALNGNTYTSNLFNETKADAQKCYMCIGSTGGSSYQAPTADDQGKDPFEVGVAPMPQFNSENKKAIQQGPSICLFKKSNPQEVAAAWLFAKYFTTSVEFQANSSMKNGYTPVIKSVFEHPTYKAWIEDAKTSTSNADLQAKTVRIAEMQQDYYYTSIAFNGSSAAREYVGTLMQTCLSKKDVFIETEFANTIATLKHKFSE